MFDTFGAPTDRQVLAARLAKAVAEFKSLAADFEWVAKIEKAAADVEASLGPDAGAPSLGKAAGLLVKAYAEANRELTATLGGWKITIEREKP